MSKNKLSVLLFILISGVVYSQGTIISDSFYSSSLDEIRKLGFPLELVKSVMQAVDRNEYKRRQSPVGIKITAKAFGRDRRMPIVNRYKGV